MDQIRLDVGRFRGELERTPQGFLKVPGNITRVGVLSYVRNDGSEFRELRHPDEVFRADSIGSLRYAPVTDRHPAGLVTAQNVRGLQVGIVADARKDDRFIAGDLIVQDERMIAKIDSGDARELSAGYTCQVDPTPGTFNGERYDGVQRGITYNHVAIGPANWGRAGSDVRLHLDGVDSELIPLIGVERLDQANLSPRSSFTLEELRQLRRARSERFGIEIVSGGSLTYPSGYPTRLEDYGDPVNLKYPIAPPDRARNARARFKQAADETYDNRRSKAVIHERIVARLLEIGAKPSIDLSDPLDRLLPNELIKRIEKARGDSRTKGIGMETVQIKIDGLDLDVPKTAAAILTKAISDRDSKIGELTARADKAEGERDAATKAHEETQTKLDAATKPETVAAAVKARVALIDAARKVLGDETKLDDMSDRDIKIAVIQKSDAEFKADGRSDDYLEGLFVGAIRTAPEQNKHRADAKKAIADLHNPPPTDGKEIKIDSAESARAAAERSVMEAHTRPLANSVQNG